MGRSESPPQVRTAGIADPDPERVARARRNLASGVDDKVADYVARVVAQSPPLSPELRHRIERLLAPFADDEGGEAR